MIRRTLLIGVCLTCAACLGGQDLRAQSAGIPESWRPFQLFNTNSTPHPAVVRVFAPERDGMSVGSGTLVATGPQYGLVVTNWHVVRDASGEVSVAFPDGFRSGATVLKVDQDWDLAALLIWRPHVTPMPIASAPPRPGDALTIAGYGQGDYRSVKARCTQYVSPGSNFPYEMVEVSAEARDGDSGGPILNERGELAGVLFGAGRGTTSGSQSGRVRLFLADVWPPPQLDQPHAHVASAPSLGDPEPFYSNSDRNPLARRSEPFPRDDQSFPPDAEPLARDRELIERETNPPPQPIHRLARTNTDATDSSWSGTPSPADEPRFVRMSSDDPSSIRQPDEQLREAPSPAVPSTSVRPTAVNWDWIVGETLMEKAKTALAAIGLLAMVIQLAKLTGGKDD